MLRRIPNIEDESFEEFLDRREVIIKRYKSSRTFNYWLDKYNDYLFLYITFNDHKYKRRMYQCTKALNLLGER